MKQANERCPHCKKPLVIQVVDYGGRNYAVIMTPKQAKSLSTVKNEPEPN